MSRKSCQISGHERNCNNGKEAVMGFTLEHFSEGGEIAKIIDNIKKRTPLASTKVAFFIYDDNLPITELFETLPDGYEESQVSTRRDRDGVLLLGFQLKQQDKADDKRGEAYLLIDKKLPFATLFTDYDKRNFQCIITFFNKYYPFLSRIFFRSDDIKKLLSSIEKKINAEILVENYVLKRRYEKKLTRNSYETTNYEEIFDSAAEDYLWVDNVDVEIKSKLANGKVGIRRDGIIRYKGGINYSVFKCLCIDEVLSLYDDRLNLMRERSSRSLKQLEPRPVRFAIHDDVFRSNKDIQRLIEVIHRSLSHWGYFTFDEEGASLFLLLHDYVSGSSYEIIVVSISEIIVIPQTRVTSPSFNELINCLTRFYDGELEEWQPT